MQQTSRACSDSNNLWHALDRSLVYIIIWRLVSDNMHRIYVTRKDNESFVPVTQTIRRALDKDVWDDLVPEHLWQHKMQPNSGACDTKMFHVKHVEFGELITY